MVKNLPAMQVTWLLSLGREDPLEKGMATHFSILALKIPWIDPFTFHIHALEKEMAACFSILAWKIPWTEVSGGLQFMELHRVRHGWVSTNNPL